jgi:phage baseplate assembly protein gpV
MSDALLQDLMERMRGRFFGKYRGVVSDVDAATMRIKATIPAVLGETTSGWCEPCVPYAGKEVGFVMLPEVGSGVWIEFEGGDTSYPIWVGGFWRKGEFPPKADADVKAVFTKAGSLSFDTAGTTIEAEHADGHTVTMES